MWQKPKVQWMTLKNLHEDFECEGAPRERSNHRKKRPKGSFRKLNSQNRLHGSGYIKFNTFNLVAPKTLGVSCLGNCKKMGTKCSSFLDDDRKKIFDAYYSLPSIQLQREFICRHVDSGPTVEKRAGENSRRQSTNTYHLTIRKQRTKVCKKFFFGNARHIRKGASNSNQQALWRWNGGTRQTWWKSWN